MGGDISSGVATLGDGQKATPGGGAVLRRGRRLMGNATLNFSGTGWAQVQEGEYFFCWAYVVSYPWRIFYGWRRGRRDFLG